MRTWPSVRLGTSVYIRPLRDPHVTARAVGSLDSHSGGRVELGIGVGWLEEEFDAVGQEFCTRVPGADEIVEILRGLWGPAPTRDWPAAHGGVGCRADRQAARGRAPSGDPDPFTVIVGAAGTTGVDDVRRYADAGVDRICLRPWRRGEEPQRGLDRLAELIATV